MAEAPPKFTPAFLLSVTSTALGSAFIHGYNLGVTNPPEQILKAFLGRAMSRDDADLILNEATVTNAFAIVVSALCVGGLIGAMLVPPLTQKCGRRKGLLASGVFAVTGGFCLLLAKPLNSYHLLVVGRALVGVHAGVSAGIAPLYFAEISPESWKGAVGTIYQLVVVIAILFSQILGLDSVLGTDTLWPFLLAGGVLCPVAFMAMLLPLCPESPSYLMNVQKNERQAEQALKRLRGREDVGHELKKLKVDSERIRQCPRARLADVLHTGVVRKGFVIAVVVMLAQPLSGINAVIFFSTMIFRSAGLSEDSAALTTVGISGVNLLSTICSLCIIDRAGRRTLLLTGLIGMATCTALLTVSLANLELHRAFSWLSIVGVFGFIMMFAIGPGSIPWFLPTELLPSPAQPLATGACVAVNWGFNIVVGWTFPILMTLIGHLTFLVFFAFLVTLAVFVWRSLPETRGKALEGVLAQLESPRKVEG